MLTSAEVATSRYGISRVRAGSDKQYLVLEHLGVQVLDAMWMPRFADSLVFSAGCAYERQLQTGDSTLDTGIMGVAVPEASRFLSKVMLAWRADTTTERFRIISPAGLRCYNEGWGVD